MTQKNSLFPTTLTCKTLKKRKKLVGVQARPIRRTLKQTPQTNPGVLTKPSHKSQRELCKHRHYPPHHQAPATEARESVASASTSRPPSHTPATLPHTHGLTASTQACCPPGHGQRVLTKPSHRSQRELCKHRHQPPLRRPPQKPERA